MMQAGKIEVTSNVTIQHNRMKQTGIDMQWKPHWSLKRAVVGGQGFGGSEPLKLVAWVAISESKPKQARFLIARRRQPLGVDLLSPVRHGLF